MAAISSRDEGLPMPELAIPVTGRFSYEVMADVMTVLAFPEVDESRRRKIAVLLCGWYVHELLYRASEHAFDPLPHLNPDHLTIEDRSIMKFIRQMNDRLRRLERAAHVAIAILQDAAPGEPASTPEDLGPRSVESVMLWHLGREGGDEANFKKRKWRPAQPVIHLAAALAVKMQDCVRNGMEPPGVFELMYSPQNLIDLLEEAAAYEQYVEAATRLKLANKNMIRLRLVA